MTSLNFPGLSFLICRMGLVTSGNFPGVKEGWRHPFHCLSGDKDITEQGKFRVEALTGRDIEGESVHTGLVVSALKVQRYPTGLAPPHHQPLPAQVYGVVVTAVGLHLQVTSLHNQICRDSEGCDPGWRPSASCDPPPPHAPPSHTVPGA